MSDGPCKALYDTYITAMHEWIRAAALSHRWASEKPLSLTEDVTPLTLAQAEEMGRDFEHEDSARKEYTLRMEAYFSCRNAHPTAH